jgi:class 3 adenylate cyclase
VIIGCSVTLSVTGAYLFGKLDWLERKSLDNRFEYANSIEPSGQIAIIGIDDRSIQKIGRWPWPRDKQAPLVSIPAEFGARRILVDLTWLEFEPERTATNEFADLMPEQMDLLADTVGTPIEPDEVLSRAIATAGNVYLAYHHLDVDLVHSGAFLDLVDLVARGDESGARALADRIGRDLVQRVESKEDRVRLRPLDLARITAALMGDPLLNEDGVCKITGLAPGYVNWAFSQCYDTAVRQRLRRWLDADPARWNAAPLESFERFYALVTGRALELRTPIGRAIGQACRHLFSYRPTTSKPIGTGDALGALAQPVDSIEPVHFRLAGKAARCCYANFGPDRDGVVRWLTLVEQHQGNILSQLGFTVAWDDLGLTAERVRIEGAHLVLRTDAAAPLTIQLDDRNRTLIPWARGSDWREQYKLYPATFVMRMYDLRTNHEDNARLERKLLRLVFSAESLPDFRLYAEMVATRRDTERLLGTDDPVMAAFFRQQIEQIDAQLMQGERELRDLVQRPGADHAAEPAALEPQIIDDLVYYLGEIDRTRAANLAIEADMAQHAQVLRDAFNNRICLIGYTATSLADFKPIPTVSKGAPGILAHANILSGMITDQMVYWLPTWLGVVFTLILGLTGTGISTLRKPRDAVVWVLFLGAMYTAMVYLVFYAATLWVQLTAPLAGLLLSYVSIAVYRYIFVDGERRQLATALGQYTSKEIARQMAEDPELCQRAEQREVTSIFTDLRGFTTISERIGAERTQKLLNTCLGCFTDVIIRHEGMVNKFMGDGIFAFWNPVIYPQVDHARRACEAGIDLLIAIDQLKAEQRAASGDQAFQDLFLRVGVATGQAIVGPCGSEQKYDYTCIGDSVNLAARLESANKFYGTGLLVGGPAREQAGAGFEYRALGGVQVKGKTEAVPVYELLGRTGKVAADRIGYAEQFGLAVSAFQQRRWAEAIERFADCARQWPSDLAARRYREAAESYRERPPSEDWNGAIELKEK